MFHMAHPLPSMPKSPDTNGGSVPCLSQSSKRPTQSIVNPYLSIRPLAPPNPLPPSLITPPKSRNMDSSHFHPVSSSPTFDHRSVTRHEQLSVSSEQAAPPVRENTGRWSAPEHRLFLQGLEQYGKGWKKIAALIKTRSVVQVRTHAQKYFQKLAKAEQKQKKQNEQNSQATKRKEMSSSFSPMPPCKRISENSVQTVSGNEYLHAPHSNLNEFNTTQMKSSPTLGTVGAPHRVSCSSLTSEDMPKFAKLDDDLLRLIDDCTSLEPDPVTAGTIPNPTPVHPIPVSREVAMVSPQVVSSPYQYAADSFQATLPPPRTTLHQPEELCLPQRSSIQEQTGHSQHPVNTSDSNFDIDSAKDIHRAPGTSDALTDLCDPLDWLADMSMKESFQVPIDNTETYSPEGTGIMKLTPKRVTDIGILALLDCDDF